MKEKVLIQKFTSIIVFLYVIHNRLCYVILCWSVNAIFDRPLIPYQRHEQKLFCNIYQTEETFPLKGLNCCSEYPQHPILKIYMIRIPCVVGISEPCVR